VLVLGERVTTGIRGMLCHPPWVCHTALESCPILGTHSTRTPPVIGPTHSSMRPGSEPDRNQDRPPTAGSDQATDELSATVERLTDQVRLLALLVAQTHDELQRSRCEERRPPDYCAACPFIELVKTAVVGVAVKTSLLLDPECHQPVDEVGRHRPG
jgi:hypothetical protein